MVDLMLTVSYIDGVFHQREWAFLEHYVDSVLVMIEQSAVGSPTIAPGCALPGAPTSTSAIAGSRPRSSVLAQEVMASRATTRYVASRLRVRAITLFRNLHAGRSGHSRSSSSPR